MRVELILWYKTEHKSEENKFMTENILALFSVSSQKSPVKLITKDKLVYYCLKSWLGTKTIQERRRVASATLCYKDSETKQGTRSTTHSKWSKCNNLTSHASYPCNHPQVTYTTGRDCWLHWLRSTSVAYISLSHI